MEKNSWDVTLYLRGIAIVSVIIYHYLAWYFQPENLGLNIPKGWWTFGNGFVAIFFVLSGFGIYHSLERRFNGQRYTRDKVAKYYFDRFVRIFPLFWFALIIDIIFFNYHFHWLSIIGYRMEEAYWFIFAILQCYLISIVLYYVLKKINVKKFIALVCSSIIIISIIYYGFFILEDAINNNIMDYLNIMYRQLIFSHIFLFSMGMTIPLLIKKYDGKICLEKKYLLLSFLFFLLYIILTGGIYGFPTEQILAAIFMITTFFMVLFFLASKTFFPFQRSLSMFGRYSLSLFLLHLIYFKTLENLQVIENNSIESIFLTMIFFPAFFVFCIILEKLFSSKSNSISQIKNISIKYYKKNKKPLIVIIAVLVFFAGYKGFSNIRDEIFNDDDEFLIAAEQVIDDLYPITFSNLSYAFESEQNYKIKLFSYTVSSKCKEVRKDLFYALDEIVIAFWMSAGIKFDLPYYNDVNESIEFANLYFRSARNIIDTLK